MATTRRKTTVYVDQELIRAVKEIAATSGRRDYEVWEDALRSYLDAWQVSAERRALREFLDRSLPHSELTDDEALDLAYSELRASRRARGRG